MRKLVLWLAILVTMIDWPIRAIKDPPKPETSFIWQKISGSNEEKLLIEKLGLDTSGVKRIYYNTKTTIILDRYTKNALATIDPINYFSGNTQTLFPYISVAGFWVGILILVKKKKHIKLLVITTVVALLIAFFQKTSEWNFLMYPLIGLITINGLKEIFKSEHGWIFLEVITLIGITEIWRFII